MGYMRHHAIVVTTWDAKIAATAHSRATELLSSLVSSMIEGVINDYYTFLVAPDGSKEGWDISDEHNARRAAFIEWMDEQRYSDGSSPLAWVEVQYGDERGETRVIAHSDETKRCVERVETEEPKL